MTKLVEIDCCHPCPYVDGYVRGLLICKHDDIEEKLVGDEDSSIPEWCPLPDKEGVNND